MNEVQLFCVVRVDLFFAQCNDEKVMVNNGRNVKGQREGYESGTEKRGREQV